METAFGGGGSARARRTDPLRRSRKELTDDPEHRGVGGDPQAERPDKRDCISHGSAQTARCGGRGLSREIHRHIRVTPSSRQWLTMAFARAHPRKGGDALYFL